MAAAAKPLRDAGYVQRAATAHAKTKLSVSPQLAEEDGSFDAGNTDEVIDNTLAVLNTGSNAFHLCQRHTTPANSIVNPEVGECDAEQTNFACGIAQVNGTGDAVGAGAALDKPLGHRKGRGGGAGIVERAGVGEDCGV